MRIIRFRWRIAAIVHARLHGGQVAPYYGQWIVKE